MHPDRGFTILEALVALAIVGLAGVAALEALGGELRTAGRSRHAYAVAALAEERLAAVRLLPATELDPIPDSLARGRFTAPFAEYSWTASVRGVSDERDLYDVVVRVEGREAGLDLRTRIYRPRPAGPSR